MLERCGLVVGMRRGSVARTPPPPDLVSLYLLYVIWSLFTTGVLVIVQYSTGFYLKQESRGEFVLLFFNPPLLFFSPPSFLYAQKMICLAKYA